MDAQTKIANLKRWFYQILESDKSPYFMLAKPVGNSSRQITNGGPGVSLDVLWKQVEDAIHEQYSNGVRKFTLTARKGGAKGSPFESVLDLGFSLVNQSSSINGMPGQQQNGIYSTESIAAIENRIEEKYREREQRLVERFDWQKKFDDMQATIVGMQQDNRTAVEKGVDSFAAIIEGVNNIDFQGIAQLWSAIKMGQADPSTVAKMAGIHGVKNSKIVEQPLGKQTDQDETEEEFEMDVQDWKAVDWGRELRKHGIENSGDYIAAAVKMYLKNPTLGESVLKPFLENSTSDA
ncbi:MAG: hypothetical protein AAFZ15_17315 [Bacteroidota bacterium]